MAVVVGVTWAATVWLLREADLASDRPAARVEAIKTGLGIGAGTAAVFTLLLAVRRQWHQERSTEATELDAAEKRVTELYTKASDQLGSDKAAVRLAGLYALERVAQNNADQRQTIVNVLCAYLRMPYRHDPPDDAPDEDENAYRERVQEREVRLTAQRILENHLHPRGQQAAAGLPGGGPAADRRDRPSSAPAPTFWAGIDLDLSGAVLFDVNLRACVVNRARFQDTYLVGDAVFTEARFGGAAVFSGARFTGTADFDSAKFDGDALFDEAGFGEEALFRAVECAGEAAFTSAVFTAAARFVNVKFAETAGFVEARFAGEADFRGALFDRDTTGDDALAWFAGVPHNLGVAWFDRAEFAGDADFDGTRFTGRASFDEARFTADATFENAEFTRRFIDPARGAEFAHGRPRELGEAG